MSAIEFGAYAQRNLNRAARRRREPLRAAEPDVFAALQARLDALLRPNEPIRMLNAGCGRGARYVPVARERFVVGIDIEAGPADGGEDIDERLVGDLETFDFGSRRFDVVYCWDVLEHVGDPRQVLLNLQSTLEPGGLIILGLPHAASVKGLITRLTPHWVHEWLWRRVLGKGAASDDAAGPFPTVLSKAMTPRAIQAFAREQGLSVQLYSEYEAWPQKKIRSMLGLTGRAFAAVSAIVRIASFGRVTAQATDLVIVLAGPG